jgi:hypothetical protein
MLVQIEEAIRRYSSPRAGSCAWAEPEIVEAWRDGRVVAVPPRTLEYAPSLRCNMGSGTGGCTACPYLPVRRAAGGNIPLGQFADPDDQSVAGLASAKLVIDRAREAGVRGVLFTGGAEPAVCPELDQMLVYSASLGLANALYTNGIQFGAIRDLAPKILDPATGLSFVRVSLNILQPGTAAIFARASEEYVAAQYDGFTALCDGRSALASAYASADTRPPAIQISVICDRRNIGDLPLIAERVAAIYSVHSTFRHPDDGFVVRPLTHHCRPRGYAYKQHEEVVINEILRQFGKSGPGPSRRVLERAGMPVWLGFGLAGLDLAAAPASAVATYEDITREEYASRDSCWANGLFLTVGPAGSVHLCTDRNCYPAWQVGDLREQSVAQIYAGDRRRSLLAAVNSRNCGPCICEPTCRAVRLNAIARAVRSGVLGDEAIAEIRRRSAGDRGLLLS